MYVSPEQATGAPVDASSDIYSLGVVAYECLAGHVPFMASEPLAIAYAHKHAPVPALPPDVPQPVADLVYEMLAKTPAGRPAHAQVVADRAAMLRDALFLGDATRGGPLNGGAPTGGFAGVTRADLPAAPTGGLRGDSRDPVGSGPRPPGRRRRWMTAGLTALVCALAAATGLYLSGHKDAPTSGDLGNNTVQHLSSSAGTPAQTTSQPGTASPSASTVEQPSTTPDKTARPKISKTSKPTSSPRTSSPPSSTSPTSPASSSSASASASSSSSASASSSPSSPPPSTP
jgi:eukaryotic-like serine/threonine-protein kinase